jgi:predicted dehydrogenase
VTDLRFGIVGLGNWGERLAAAVGTLEGVHLEVCFARSEEARSGFAARHGCRAAPSLDSFLAEEVDGILVATPHTTHRELVTAIASAGRHIMVEKPLALTLEDARACVAAAEANDVLLQVAHFRRLAPATRAVRAAIDEGKLGTLHSVQGWFSRIWGPQTHRPWRDDPAESPLGGMTALGIHLVDNFHYLVGPIRRVACWSTQIGAITAIDDVTVAMLEFESGPVGTLTTSLRLPFQSTTAVFGSGGAAWSEDDGSTFAYQGRDEHSPVRESTEPVDGVGANLEAFRNSIRSGVPPETGGREGLAVVAVLEAMIESARRGGAVVDVAS